MKRRTNTLDAEYKRRGLIRPTQAKRGVSRINDAGNPEWLYVHDRRAPSAVSFDWKGTSVWGVKA